MHFSKNGHFITPNFPDGCVMAVRVIKKIYIYVPYKAKDRALKKEYDDKTYLH